MTELKIPPRANLRPYKLSRAFMEYPGRNHPDIGKWLAETYTKPRDQIIDPMCGVGQMWLSAPEDRQYFLSDQNNAVREIPDSLADWYGDAALLQIGGRPALVAFSPQYPQAHDAGKNEHQVQMRDEKGDHAIQGFDGPGADMPAVYRNIASWGFPRMAVVVRNRIVNGVETDWVVDNLAMAQKAGYNHLEEFWRHVHPTRWQQAKLKRDPSTPVIDREWILVMTRCP